MSLLPVYDTLCLKELSKEKLTDKENKKIIKEITRMSEDAKEIVYMIIREHYRRSKEGKRKNSKRNKSLPYSGKQLATGIEFCFNDFPTKLRRILQEFVELNKNTDNQREEDINEQVTAIESSLIDDL